MSTSFGDMFSSWMQNQTPSAAPPEPKPEPKPEPTSKQEETKKEKQPQKAEEQRKEEKDTRSTNQKNIEKELAAKKEQTTATEGGTGTNSVTPEAAQPRFEFDRYFLSWLRSINSGIVISSYKTHKVFSLGVLNHEGQDKLSMWLSQFNRPMGVHTSKEAVWVSSSGNLWKFRNGEKEFTDPNLGKFDRVYVPSKAYFSNDIDAHDICVDDEGTPYYCSALFGCVCVPSDTHSFKVFWRPPWLTKTAPEDRCHLNGICTRDGKPRYISAVCKGNVKGAWREQRIGKGVICDIQTNEIVCEGLSMPHSPRWHNGKLWVLEAGTGYFGYVDFETKKFVQKVFIPGYLRGLAFVDDKYALVGSSEDRHEQCFQGLPLGDRLKEEGITAKCGMYVIDLKTFDQPHHLIFYSPINELYDICVLPGCHRPKIADVGDEANMREYTIDYNGYEN